MLERDETGDAERLPARPPRGYAAGSDPRKDGMAMGY